jgi:biopolymer transport protein ExbB
MPELPTHSFAISKMSAISSPVLIAVDLTELFFKGGVFMWPLLFCSVLGLAVLLDRFIFFLSLWPSRKIGEKVHALLVKNTPVAEVINICARSRHPAAATLRVFLENLNRPQSLQLELVKSEGALQLERVEKRLRVLATISHLAPLLGLLGTVTGLVTAFSQLQELGVAARPADLAGGIWEALLTTVFGLIVAIPCMAGYHAFEGIADRIAREMQRAIVRAEDAMNRAPAECPIKAPSLSVTGTRSEPVEFQVVE